jgi:hypothetical protein
VDQGCHHKYGSNRFSHHELAEDVGSGYCFLSLLALLSLYAWLSEVGRWLCAASLLPWVVQPIFYTSHAFYDRLFHFVMTSPELKQTLNMTWGVRHYLIFIDSSVDRKSVTGLS